MTRINLLPPSLLTDQHLMAEKREINLLAGHFKKSFHSKSGITLSRIPDKYSLNTNHVYFFYNKRSYLKKRFNSICLELEERHYKLNVGFYDIWSELVPNQSEFDILFEPCKRDYKIVIDRILHRVSEKPNWYRYKRVPFAYLEYKGILEKFLENS